MTHLFLTLIIFFFPTISISMEKEDVTNQSKLLNDDANSKKSQEIIKNIKGRDFPTIMKDFSNVLKAILEKNSSVNPNDVFSEIEENIREKKTINNSNMICFTNSNKIGFAKNTLGDRLCTFIFNKINFYNYRYEDLSEEDIKNLEHSIKNNGTFYSLLKGEKELTLSIGSCNHLIKKKTKQK